MNQGTNESGKVPLGAPALGGAAPTQSPRLGSQELLRGGRRLINEHGEASYTLQLTRNGKLILTK